MHKIRAEMTQKVKTMMKLLCWMIIWFKIWMNPMKMKKIKIHHMKKNQILIKI